MGVRPGALETEYTEFAEYYMCNLFTQIRLFREGGLCTEYGVRKRQNVVLVQKVDRLMRHPYIDYMIILSPSGTIGKLNLEHLGRSKTRSSQFRHVEFPKY